MRPSINTPIHTLSIGGYKFLHFGRGALSCFSNGLFQLVVLLFKSLDAAWCYTHMCIELVPELVLGCSVVKSRVHGGLETRCRTTREVLKVRLEVMRAPVDISVGSN